MAGFEVITEGFVPLSPYFAFANPQRALIFSITVTLVALAVFGYLKGKATGALPIRSAFQTAVIGGLAAAAAFALAKAIS